MSLQEQITALAQAVGADIKALQLAAARTGDLVFSLDASRYTLPNWLPCDGNFVPDASAPLSLQPYMSRASGVNFSSDGAIKSTGVAPRGVLDMFGDYALLQVSAAPFGIPMVKNPVGYSYVRDSFGTNPSAAFKCAALGLAGETPNILGFSTAAGSAFYARRLSSVWSVSNVATTFAGKVFTGCVYGADGKFYMLSTTAPYLHSIDGAVQSSNLVDVGGVGASGVGMCISSNKKYMVTWHSVAPFINVFEFDGTQYVKLGSPPLGAASFLRVEVSDTGVVVGKPTSSSVYSVCSVTPSGAVGAMTASTVNAATSWGIMPDGRHLISWLTNALTYYPILNDSLGAGTPVDMYSSAAFGTIAGRMGLVPGRILTSSSIASSGYGMAGNVGLTGWMAPKIKNAYLRA